MKLQRVLISGNGVSLSGLVYAPREETDRPFLIVSHGFTASKESVDLLAAYLCGRGYPCLTFDFRGHKLGGSTGDLNKATDTLDDLESAIAYAKTWFDAESCVLVGHSMGALVSLLVAERTPEVAAVVAITTGPQPSAGFRQPVGIAMLQQRADYVSGAPAIQILEEFDALAAGFRGLGDRRALFVGARGDAVVKPSRVREMSERAGRYAEYAEIDGTHLEAPDRARGVVANWLDRINHEGTMNTK